MKSGLAGMTGGARSLTLEPSVQTVGWAEKRVGLGGLFGVIGVVAYTIAAA